MLNVTEILASVRATLRELEAEVPQSSVDAVTDVMRAIPPGSGIRPAAPSDNEEEDDQQPEFSLVELMASLNLLDRFLWERSGRGWDRPDAAEVLELMTQVASRIALLSRDLTLTYVPPTDDEADIG